MFNIKQAIKVILITSLTFGCAGESVSDPAPAAEAEEFVYDYTINLGYPDACMNLYVTSADVRLRGEGCTEDGTRCEDVGAVPVDVTVRQGFDPADAPFGAASFVEFENCGG